jgi:tRNA1Val (adenine37-N6)-methyltransferase
MTKRQRQRHFQCQQFRIDQSDAAMKVTTDACALAAWVPLEHARRILDIGTGTGVLALFAAQRATQAQVDAIEFEPQAARQAAANFAASPFAERLQLIEGDVRRYRTCRYDTILCNPPFFSGSTVNRCDRLASARHDLSLSLTDLLAAIAALLAANGCAWLLLPVDSAQRAEAACAQFGLHLRERRALISQPGDAPHRLILGLSPEPGPLLEASLTLYREHPIHSADAGALFYPFYTRLRCEAPEWTR